MRRPALPAPIKPPTAPTMASYLTRGTTDVRGPATGLPSITPVTGASSIRVGRPSLLGGS